MKRLRKKFKSKGFIHEEIIRKGRHAIYERYAAQRHATNPGVGHVHYEVIKVGRHNGYNLGGSYIEPAETYPSTSMWGTAGWTCKDRESAQDKFNELDKYE